MCLFHQHRSKKSLLIVKLRSFQNASIEIKQIYFFYQQIRESYSHFNKRKSVLMLQNKNGTKSRYNIFVLNLKKNSLRHTNWWKKFMVMIVWVVLKFIRGLHNLKMAVTHSKKKSIHSEITFFSECIHWN